MRTEGRNAQEPSGRASVARRALLAAVTIGIAGIAYGQAAATFAVSHAGQLPASGFRNNTARVSRTPERLAFKGALVGDLVAFAYGFPLDRVERRPQWMYDDLYNVAVTTTAPASLPDQKLMLQKLLEERFGLVVHRISYPSTVYYLVQGPKVNLTPAQEPDAADIPEFRDEPWAAGSPGPSSPFRRASVARHATMSDLAALLYPQMQLPVLDKTGITGFFDITISWPTLRGGAEATIRAVRDSLGLVLEVHRGTAESLIVDQAEKPKEN
jgi:uncharacterized protein (TIGR03435 family)